VKLLWHGSWVDTPGYHVPETAALVDVIATAPIMRLEHASGRIMRQPYRKVATFLRTDGPRSTLRRARAKRGQDAFLGDFRVVAILGRVLPSQKSVIALGCRVPPSVQQVPVHRKLVREVPADFRVEQLGRLASEVARHPDILAQHCHQNYLYSAMEPPPELTNLLDAATSGDAPDPLAWAAPLSSISPPNGPGTAAPTTLRLAERPSSAGAPVALLGAGEYARTEVIPALRAAGLRLHVVADREPQIATMVAGKHDGAVAATDAERAIAELPGPGLVVVATAHDSHARLASLAVRAGHRAFLEKPPTVTSEDVLQLVDATVASPGQVEIGFNRRYHPLVRRARRALDREQGPTSITCLVKEVDLEPSHWYLWPNQGTRITGNLCHWIDLAVFLLGEPLPVSLTLSPQVSGAGHPIDEERVLTVTFDDGSLLTILATNRGDDIRGVQEQIEIRRGRTTIVLDDLWKMRVRRGGTDRRSRTLFRDKAHREMYRQALNRFVGGEPAAYPPADMVVVSAIQIAASRLASSGDGRCDPPTWLAPTLDRLA
jgi:predicted dehydrogenase